MVLLSASPVHEPHADERLVGDSTGLLRLVKLGLGRIRVLQGTAGYSSFSGSILGCSLPRNCATLMEAYKTFLRWEAHVWLCDLRQVIILN